MLALEHFFAPRVQWKRVWVTAEPAASPAGAVEAVVGSGTPQSLAKVADTLDASTRRGLYCVFRAARWGTAKMYGCLNADAISVEDMAQERLLALPDEDVQAAIQALDAANLDSRVQYVAQMLESLLEFDPDDCRDVLRSSKLSPEARAAENQRALDTIEALRRRWG